LSGILNGKSLDSPDKIDQKYENHWQISRLCIPGEQVEVSSVKNTR